MAIEILPARLANQIAAGEVVERPASVVKELVENSLDSGANRIQIDIERGGHKLIRIRDNGSGIDQHELVLALSRHATSKLKTLDDLECIASLGFRGEALASISSVSRLTLSSKPAAQETAWQAFAEGRDMAVQVQPTAHPDGTTVEVKDLFFNTPARRKFLRTEKTEFAHIEELVKRIALSRFDVAITLTHNGKVVRQFRPSLDGSNDVQRVAQVAGKAFLTEACHLQAGNEGLSLHGWLMPVGTSGTTQYTYVNGRMMRDKLILHAIRQAFEEVVGSIELPSFVLFVELDPRQVDVNVHPAKHEVRFHQARLVHDFIVQALKPAISSEVSPSLLVAHGDGVEHDHSAVFDAAWHNDFEQNQQQNSERDYVAPLRKAHQPAAEHSSYLSQQLSQELSHEQTYADSGDMLSAKAGNARGSSGSRGYTARASSPHSGTASSSSKHNYNVNALYQQLQVRETDLVAAPTEHLTTATPNFTSVMFLPLGLRLEQRQDGLYLSRYRDALACYWQSELEHQGTLNSKALLLPVRVSLSAEQIPLFEKYQSWLALLGFEIQLFTSYIIVKKLPPALYSIDVAEMIQRIVRLLMQDLVAQWQSHEWLGWFIEQIPDNFLQSQSFSELRQEIEKNPQCIARLVEKAVKIDPMLLMAQFSKEK
ncbi:DNA mismatch repair endonuclease MutL [Pseudoalteromonas fenneropenaei]|uniref:DNA mismatch repair protein MutL n=1 Tax=Pseudoalteromonas fenneropenaei TaxID=1737459 RepID=A0ABV7CKU5_9GAMM